MKLSYKNASTHIRVSQQILYHTVHVHSVNNAVTYSYRTQLPAIKASGEESFGVKAQSVLEQDTVVSSNWKDEDTSDSCSSLGSEKSSTHSRSVSYLPMFTIIIQNFLCIWWSRVGPHTHTHVHAYKNGYAIVQAVRYQLLIMEALVQSQCNPCGTLLDF
jgi:hypothetical protein